jgi:hypothetical protein
VDLPQELCWRAWEWLGREGPEQDSVWVEGVVVVRGALSPRFQRFVLSGSVRPLNGSSSEHVVAGPALTRKFGPAVQYSGR